MVSNDETPEESLRIWVGDAPGRPESLPALQLIANAEQGPHPQWAQGVAVPQLRVFRPARPSGLATLILPGGGYAFVSFEGEGNEIARRFLAANITSFVLTYRLPGDGWADRASVPLQDAQRAMRVIRALAVPFGIDPAKLGVVGFSAGGHMAATLATCHAETTYAPRDGADMLSARPAFAGLLYPVISLRPPTANLASRINLLGQTPSDAEIDARSPALRVTADTPRCFLAHAMDDTIVPPENSLDMLASSRTKGVAAEAHFFEKGGHGFGLSLPESIPAGRWPELFFNWVNAA